MRKQTVSERQSETSATCVSKSAVERLVSYDQMTTDELLEALPHNLHVARNDNAPEDDRWRVYNMASGKYCEPGARTAREVMIYALNRLAEQCKAWTGRE